MGLFDEVEVRSRFPELQAGQFEITSPKTTSYNCVAWAAGDSSRWWWPDPQCYWPKGILRKKTVDTFVQVFQSLGYELCDNADLELGAEKIAIFVGPLGTPTHAARQEANGEWTSKLGKLHDIRHVLDQVGGFRGDSYGTATKFMRRPIK